MNNKNLSNEENENSILSTITGITCIGDFISLFAFLKIIQDAGFGPLYSGYSVVVQSIAEGASGVLFPFLSSFLKTKTILILSQWLSVVASFVALITYIYGSINFWIFLSVLFILTLCFKLFEGAREHHSKSLGSFSTQASLQSQLLSAFYKAQFLGPILSIQIISILPLWVPLFIDSLSFIVAGFLVFKIKNTVVHNSSAHFLKPFKYIWNFPELRDIFFLRSVGFWLGNGLFNYLMFSVVVDKFHLDVINTAWIFSAIGFGGFIGSFLIRNNFTGKMTIFGSACPFLQACIGNTIIGISVVLFFNVNSFFLCLLFSILDGVGVAINASSTQTIRRQQCSSEQFPEIVGLETIIGRIVSFIISTIAMTTISSKLATYQGWLFFAGSSCLIVAFIFLKKFIRNKQITSF